MTFTSVLLSRFISAPCSSRKRSSEVIPFGVGPVEQELQGRGRVELQLGVRLERNVGVVGDQEWCVVPGSAVLLAWHVRQAAAVRTAGGIHHRQALRERVGGCAWQKVRCHEQAWADAADD